MAAWLGGFLGLFFGGSSICRVGFGGGLLEGGQMCCHPVLVLRLSVSVSAGVGVGARWVQEGCPGSIGFPCT